jgi:D-alanyl-D-alanine carboxypeptidase
VASATRDGRKLVAVVLGEQSLATRRVRATDLLENGFRRYFWKSLFGTSIDGLAIQASLTDGPAHLKDAICGIAKPKLSARKVSRKVSPKVSRKGGSKKRSIVSTGAN